MSILERNNVHLSGPPDGQPIIFAHGFGCDQNMWRFVAPAFSDRYRVVLFDYVGAGKSDSSAYDAERYSSLGGYASDVLEICHALRLEKSIFVGHSVSSMIGVLAANMEPELFDRLVMVGPSPRYINDGDYVGGFASEDIDGLLDSLAGNFLGWSSAMAPVIVGNPDRPELAEELTDSFCRTNPVIARQFATTTFRSDNRNDLSGMGLPTLILQCSDDVIAPASVGRFVHEKLPNSVLVNMKATGHCPNLSAPDETIAAIQEFLTRSSTSVGG